MQNFIILCYHSTMDWLPYSIASTLLLGISMSLYKMPAFKGYSSFISTIWTNAFSALFVFLGLFLLTSNGVIDGFTNISWYALLWGTLFAGNMVLIKLLL